MFNSKPYFLAPTQMMTQERVRLDSTLGLVCKAQGGAKLSMSMERHLTRMSCEGRSGCYLRFAIFRGKEDRNKGILIGGLALLLSAAKMSDQGIYCCDAANDFGPAPKMCFNVSVYRRCHAFPSSLAICSLVCKANKKKLRLAITS